MDASTTFAGGPHEWQVSSRADLAPAFRRARRHSRFVRTLRYGIPITVAVVVGLYALVSWLDPWGTLARLPMGKLTMSGTRITMDAPRMAGFTRDGRAYEMTATSASQDLKKPQTLELKDIRAKMELQDGVLVNVTADTGVYDTKTEALVMRQNVVVATSTGTEVRMIETFLDMRKGQVLSEKPVEVVLPNGKVNANQMEVVNSGAVVYFRGGVTMLMQPEMPATTAADKDEASQTATPPVAARTDAPPRGRP